MNPLIKRDFKNRQKYYSRRGNLPYRWQKEYPMILGALQLMQHSPCNIKTVVELGCADGALAVQCLNDLPNHMSWTGYDIAKQWIAKSLEHPRYKPILLRNWLWKLKLSRFDVFVSSHTIEHLFPDELQRLAEWLSDQARYVVLAVPSPHIVQGQHVLGKSSEWIKEQFKDNGFRLVWEVGGWFGWFSK